MTNFEVDEELIQRAALLLAWLSEEETASELAASGVGAEQAFLAIKAGKVLNKAREHTADTASGLNPTFWQDEELNKGVRLKLLEIAKDFWACCVRVPTLSGTHLNTPAILDILLVGSLASTTWTRESDLDLHLVVDMSKADDNIALVKDYYAGKKQLWNDEHDIEIHGHPVEVYVQNVGEALHAQGQYSLLRGQWLSKPTGKTPSVDDNAVKAKTKAYQKEIEALEALFNQGWYAKASAKAEKLKAKLKAMRSSGLASGSGELSVENLVYKQLRRTGYLSIVWDIATKAYDAQHSIGKQAALKLLRVAKKLSLHNRD